MDASLALESFRYDNDEMWFEMMMQVGYIQSVNWMHGFNRKTGTVYLLPEVVKMKSKIREQVAKVDPLAYCQQWLDPQKFYVVNYQFILKQGFLKRDCDNCIKLTQDALFECLHIDDSRIDAVSARKLYKPEASHEYIIVRVSRSHFNYKELK